MGKTLTRKLLSLHPPCYSIDHMTKKMQMPHEGDVFLFNFLLDEMTPTIFGWKMV
jgi:hypothetical protein